MGDKVAIDGQNGGYCSIFPAVGSRGPKVRLAVTRKVLTRLSAAMQYLLSRSPKLRGETLESRTVRSEFLLLVL